MSPEDLSTLIAKTAQGDRAAFRALYQATSPKLFGVCVRILKDQDEAEDALQEVYVRIWRAAGKFEPSGYSPFAWLIAITRNHAIDRVRARKPAPRPIAAAHDLADEGPTPEQAAMRSSDRRVLEACLDELGAPQAAAVREAYIEGYSYQELSERHRTPLNTIRTWLRRSLIKLKECLQR